MYSELTGISPEDLVVTYAPLVKRIGLHLMGRLPSSVQLDDLLQAGMLGLLDASQHYQANKGASFETFASIRIRGAMLDEIRAGDWAPRSVHRNGRAISQAIQTLESQLGREARDTEVAEFLHLQLDEYRQQLQDMQGTRLIPLELFTMPDDESQSPQDIAAVDDNPLHDLQKIRFRTMLAEAISQLPERERLVLSLYYDEELNLKEIGAVLGVSESRVSQLHSQTMLRLAARLSAWRD